MAKETLKEEKKNLYQKLLVIQQRIVGLGKDKSAFNYKYVTGDKVLGEIKPLMNEMGLLLKQEVLSIENARQDYQLIDKSGNVRNKSEILSKVMMRFTWVDCETGEKDENLFGANGQNDWDKGCGSAYTYAERYFLLKYFHIATDEDDIDNSERKDETKSVPAPKPVQVKEDSEANRVATMQGRSNPEFPSGLGQSILNAKTQEDLKVIWESNTALHTEKKFTDAVTARKKEILNK